MPRRLLGKIALISGGATGMGGASSKLFAAEGAKIGVVDRKEEAGRAVVAEIERAGGTAMFAAADVADEAQVNAAVADATGRWSAERPFNHAGTIVIKPFLETTLEEWEWLMRSTSLHVPHDQGRAAAHDRGGWRIDRLHVLDISSRGDADGSAL